jgi:hypothetical protein
MSESNVEVNVEIKVNVTAIVGRGEKRGEGCGGRRWLCTLMNDLLSSLHEIKEWQGLG